MKSFFEEFTGNYPLTKTLRFELRPKRETKKLMDDFQNNLKENEFIIDKIRADKYLKMKGILDEYYIYFIDCVLKSIQLKKDDLKNIYEKYKLLRTGQAKKEYQDLQKNFRIVIAKKFKDTLREYQLDKYGTLIKENSKLTQWLEEECQKGRITPGECEEKKETITYYYGFTTYFDGLKKNRENLFSDKADMTAIAYRIVHDNMEKHFDNCIRYRMIKEKYPTLYECIKEYEHIFIAEQYTNYLTQDAIDKYNHVLGHDENEKHEKGINQHINLYRQAEGIKNRDLPVFSPLFKQLMSKKSHSVFMSTYQTDEEMLKGIKTFYEQVQPGDCIDRIAKKMQTYFNSENTEAIFIKTDSLSTLSKVIFGERNFIHKAIEAHIENLKNKKDQNAYKKQTEKTINLKLLQTIIDKYIETFGEEIKAEKRKKASITAYFMQCDTAKNKIEKAYDDVREILALNKLDKDRRAPSKELLEGGKGFVQISKIKQLLDHISDAVNYLRPLHLVKEGKKIEDINKLAEFYDVFDEEYAKLLEIKPIYNSTRNHITKKPSKEGKFKINFNRPTLLNGWDENKESSNLGVLLIKDGLYYLGIMDRKCNHIFDFEKEEIRKNAIADNDKNSFKKMSMYNMSDVVRTIPCLYIKNGEAIKKYGNKHEKEMAEKANVNKKEFIKQNNLPYEIYEIYQNKTYTSDKLVKDDLIKYIEYYMKCTEKYFKRFSFNFKKPQEYNSYDEFLEDIEKAGFAIKFENIKDDYIYEKVKNGELYLFQIYNKDFSPYSKGRQNLHTMYFKALFCEENLGNIANSKDPIFKLNGEAEIFYRMASRKRAVTHPKNEPIKNKNPYNTKESSVFAYDLIKKKRFTEDKLFFHCPITINFRAPKVDRAEEFNKKVNNAVCRNEEINIIGIDRGERHLLYYTVIDKNGNILKQASLNNITSTNDNGKITMQTDYRNILDTKEKERDKARKSWAEIENIKELKSGYLSQIVHKLCMLMLEYNAVIVLENLNTGFKNSRIKVEKQVYQNFERALIEKLNYFVLKDKAAQENGGYLKGYQLCAPFESFKKLFDQSGIVYYVEPRYTSKICPDTGFVNFMDTRYTNIGNAQTFFASMEEIGYSAQEDHFIFSFDYAKYRECAGRKKWIVCTHGDERYWYDAKNMEYKLINSTEAIKKLLDDRQIEYRSGRDLREDICKVEDASFYKSMLFNLKLVLQMRYSTGGTKDEDDFILSPVKNEFGTFFDSRKAKDDMPKNADANGAYHIALKGLKLINSIEEDGSIPRPQKGKTLHEWLLYAQEKHYAKKQQEQEV